MNLLEGLDKEVQYAADDRFDAVLVKLLASLSSENNCAQRNAFFDYIRSKLDLHRANKRLRGTYYYAEVHYGLSLDKSAPYFGEAYLSNAVRELQHKTEEKRREYYVSECACGSCRGRRESQRIKYLGASASG